MYMHITYLNDIHPTHCITLLHPTSTMANTSRISFTLASTSSYSTCAIFRFYHVQDRALHQSLEEAFNHSTTTSSRNSYLSLLCIGMSTRTSFASTLPSTTSSITNPSSIKIDYQKFIFPDFQITSTSSSTCFVDHVELLQPLCLGQPTQAHACVGCCQSQVQIHTLIACDHHERSHSDPHHEHRSSRNCTSKLSPFTSTCASTSSPSTMRGTSDIHHLGSCSFS